MRNGYLSVRNLECQDWKYAEIYRWKFYVFIHISQQIRRGCSVKRKSRRVQDADCQLRNAKHPYQFLMIVTTLLTGLHFGFRSSDFTAVIRRMEMNFASSQSLSWKKMNFSINLKAFASGFWGLENIGCVLMWYGTELVWSFLAKLIGRTDELSSSFSLARGSVSYCRPTAARVVTAESDVQYVE